jgi:hypothetical protein
VEVETGRALGCIVTLCLKRPNMEKELQLKTDAATVQLQNARRTGDVRDALNVLELLLDAVQLLAAKPPH